MWQHGTLGGAGQFTRSTADTAARDVCWCSRWRDALRLPAILGYVVVGVVVGPHAFGVLHGAAEERALGEIGVVFLLFTLGLEFSYPRMVAMRREVFGLGSAQTIAVTAGGMLLAHVAGQVGPPPS